MPRHDRNLDPVSIARTAERMIALEARLENVRSGKVQPDDAQDGSEFAQLCFFKGYYADSARLWSEAFAARPALADLRGSENRHQAARAAALASGATGGDEPPPFEARSRWREQSLKWMKEELAAIARTIDSGTPHERSDIPKRLGRWRVDPALSSLRDDSTLKALNELEKRQLREFWSEVDRLFEKARTPVAFVSPNRYS